MVTTSPGATESSAATGFRPPWPLAAFTTEVNWGLTGLVKSNLARKPQLDPLPGHCGCSALAYTENNVLRADPDATTAPVASNIIDWMKPLKVHPPRIVDPSG